MSIFDNFVSAVVKKAIQFEATQLVKGWIAAGYLEASKEAECEAGIMDLVQVSFGMAAQGDAPKPHG